jgi:hypothetical protein
MAIIIWIQPKPTDHRALILPLAIVIPLANLYPAEGSFPYQLAAGLTKAKHPVSQPDIIATTGWTTDELISAINNSDKKDKKYDIVTLLIGVNNQYRGYNQETYRTEFIQLLNTAIAHANGSKNHVFVLSIPDWGVTPFADGRDRSQIALRDWPV